MPAGVAGRRRLSKDIDISTLLSMRQQGMTNKQIADSLDIHPNTVYRYIGKMSLAVNAAQMKGQPVSSVIPDRKTIEKEAPRKEEVKKHEEVKPMQEPVVKHVQTTSQEQKRSPITALKSSSLKIVSERLTLEGVLCKYIVDTESDSIEVTGDILTGLLDKETLNGLIQELCDIRDIISA